jgi:hypothetical protein
MNLLSTTRVDKRGRADGKTRVATEDTQFPPHGADMPHASWQRPQTWTHKTHIPGLLHPANGSIMLLRNASNYLPADTAYKPDDLNLHVILMSLTSQNYRCHVTTVNQPPTDKTRNIVQKLQTWSGLSMNVKYEQSCSYLDSPNIISF